MSFRDAPAPSKAFSALLQALEGRVKRLERAATLRGTPSVGSLRVGAVIITVEPKPDDETGTLQLVAYNTKTGNPPVVICDVP